MTTQLRPLSIGEILDAAFKIYFRHAVLLIKLAAPVVTLVGLISFGVEYATTADGAVVEDGALLFATDREVAIAIAGTIVATLLTAAGGLIATGALYKAIADTYVGASPTWREAMGFGVRRFHSLLWITVLTWLLLIPAFIALVIPGIWLFIAYALAPAALMAENLRGRKAIWRSYHLVKDRWWPVFTVFLVAGILTGIAQVAVALPVLGPLDVSSPTVFVALNAGATAIASIFATPFTVAATTVQYFDLRVRKEGFDLELLARAAGIELTDVPAGGIAQTVPAATVGDGSQPPFWPPPPGWKPAPPEAPPPAGDTPQV